MQHSGPKSQRKKSKSFILTDFYRSPGPISLVNESEPNFQPSAFLIYTSVTSNGLVTSFPPTSAIKVIRLSKMAVLSIISTDTSWMSAFLYQMPPLRMMSTSRSLPQEPPMWTKTALSSKSPASLSASLSAIHCHLVLESSMTSCCSGEFWAKVTCIPIRRRSKLRIVFFMFFWLMVYCVLSNLCHKIYNPIFVKGIFQLSFLDLVGIPHVAECESQHFPVFSLLLIDLCHC